MVCRRMRGLCKGFRERSEVLKEGIVRIGVRGLRVVRGSVKVCIRVYNFW